MFICRWNLRQIESINRGICLYVFPFTAVTKFSSLALISRKYVLENIKQITFRKHFFSLVFRLGSNFESIGNNGHHLSILQLCCKWALLKARRWKYSQDGGSRVSIYCMYVFKVNAHTYMNTPLTNIDILKLWMSFYHR